MVEFKQNTVSINFDKLVLEFKKGNCMINWGVLILYILTVIAYNGTPGPVIMLTTGTRLAHDFRHTVKTILGADLGSITLMLIAILAMLGLISINYNILNL